MENADENGEEHEKNARPNPIFHQTGPKPRLKAHVYRAGVSLRPIQFVPSAYAGADVQVARQFVRHHPAS
jgi:hypothetical protein